eukprot:1698447-Amphidinium_carterae.1
MGILPALLSESIPTHREITALRRVRRIYGQLCMQRKVFFDVGKDAKWSERLLYVRSKAESTLRVAEYVSKGCKTSRNIKPKLPDADEVEH